MANVLNDRYELIEVVQSAIGDFGGDCYKARERVPASPDIPAGRVVLLRRLPPRANTPAVYAAAERSRNLDRHPNILDPYGLVELPAGGNIPAGLYAVSEYVRGISLRERIRRVAPFSLGIALDFAGAIAQALQYAAEQGQVHGCLRAEEVLLTPEGQIRVADFTFAQAVNEAMGTGSDVPAQDVRALGLILYEMLTGKLPEGIGADAYSPRVVNPNVPPALDGITRKSLSTDSRTAYPSVAAFLNDITTAREDLRSGKPLTWTPITTGNRPQPKATSGLLTQAASEIALDEKRGRRRKKDDDYEPEAPESRWFGRLLMFLTILGILAIIGAVVWATRILTVPADTTVPNLVGKSVDDAKQISVASHFNLVIEGHDYNDTWPSNTIYAQDTTAGRQIKSGKDVDVHVSDGPPLIAVPDVTQVTQARAKQMIQGLGLPMGRVTLEYDDVNPHGIVSAQSPAAASMVSHKTPIDITVSKGPSPPPTPSGLSASATVPNEIDLSWNEVSDASSYDVYRDGNKIGSGVTSGEYADMHLGNSETHQYAITAVNVNGKSARSQPVSGTTMADIVTPPPAPAPIATPVTPDDTGSTSPTPAPATAPASAPPAPTPGPRTAADNLRQRQFHIRFRVPHNGADQHDIQIEIQDATGTNVVYDETRSAGRIIDEQIPAFGNKVIVRIYMDGKLLKQNTK